MNTITQKGSDRNTRPGYGLGLLTKLAVSIVATNDIAKIKNTKPIESRSCGKMLW